MNNKAQSTQPVKATEILNKAVETSNTTDNATSVIVMTEARPSSPNPSQPHPPNGSITLSDPLAIAAFVAVVIAVTKR